MLDFARIDKVCTGRLFSNLVPRVLSYNEVGSLAVQTDNLIFHH